MPISLLQDLWLCHTPYSNNFTPVISLQQQQECADSYNTTTIIPLPQAVPSANSATHVSWTKSFNIRLPSVLSLSTLTSNCWLQYNHETDPVLWTGLTTEQDLDFSRQTSKRTLWTFVAKKRCRWPAIMLYAEFVLEQDSNKAQRLSYFFYRHTSL